MLALPALMNKQGGIPNPDNTILVNFGVKATSGDFGKCGFFIYDIDSDLVLNKILNPSYAGMWSTNWRMDSEGNAYASGPVNGYYKLAKVDLLKVETIANIDYNTYGVQGLVPIVTDKYIYQQANRISDNKPCVIRVNKSDMTVESIYMVPGATTIQIFESYNRDCIWILSTSANSYPLTWNVRKWGHNKTNSQVEDYSSGYSSDGKYNTNTWDFIGARWENMNSLFIYHHSGGIAYRNPTNIDTPNNPIVGGTLSGVLATFDLTYAYLRGNNAYGDSYDFYDISYTSILKSYMRKSGILDPKDMTATKNYMTMITQGSQWLLKRSDAFNLIGSNATYASEQIFDINNATHRAKFLPSTEFYSGYLSYIHTSVTSRLRTKPE